MGIRTPCYTKIKQQIILVIWVSEHHAILQWKIKWYMLWGVISVKLFLSFCNCIGAHFCNNKNQAILQQKIKIILVTWVSEHHAILQQKNTIILVTRVSEHHAILQEKNKIMLVTWVSEHHDILQLKSKFMLVK